MHACACVYVGVPEGEVAATRVAGLGPEGRVRAEGRLQLREQRGGQRTGVPLHLGGARRRRRRRQGWRQGWWK